jgi:hypothetical protein
MFASGLRQRLQRRGQRGYEFPNGRTILQWFEAQGFITLSGCTAKRHPLTAGGESFSGELDAGNPHVWFGAGEVGRSVTYLCTLPARNRLDRAVRVSER